MANFIFQFFPALANSVVEIVKAWLNTRKLEVEVGDIKVRACKIEDAERLMRCAADARALVTFGDRRLSLPEISGAAVGLAGNGDVVKPWRARAKF